MAGQNEPKRGSGPENPTHSLEVERLALEKERFQLEKNRARSEGQFSNKYLGIALTSALTLAAVLVSATQVWVAYLQKEKETELASIEQHRRWMLDVATFVTDHKEVMFGRNTNEQRQIRNVMVVCFPPEITVPLFGRLEVTAVDEVTNVWREGTESIRKTAPWAWSLNSSIYHSIDCYMVGSIKPESLRMGQMPPAGKTKHLNCAPFK